MKYTVLRISFRIIPNKKNLFSTAKKNSHLVFYSEVNCLVNGREKDCSFFLVIKKKEKKCIIDIFMMMMMIEMIVGCYCWLLPNNKNKNK